MSLPVPLAFRSYGSVESRFTAPNVTVSLPLSLNAAYAMLPFVAYANVALTAPLSPKLLIPIIASPVFYLISPQNVKDILL
jgi:hypothetical protein